MQSQNVWSQIRKGENLMPIYKRCSRCGKRILSGSKCSCGKERHREYDRYSRDKKSKEFYDSSEWARSRQQALDLDDGIDVYLYMTSGEIKAADTLHHIVPLKDDWDRRLDPRNLMSLHHDTHSMIERDYKKNKPEMIEKLSKMLRDYRKQKV